MEESYKTLKISSSDEFEEKRSRFIGYASPVKTEKEALDFIADIKQKHWDAKHNVYAYCIRNGGIMRYSDDGEPQGTAGMPVLSVMQKEKLTDCVVVVTRYFGGILLGGGGLVRAYSHAAKLGIDSAGIIIMEPWNVYSLVCDYTFYSKIETFIRDSNGVIIDSQFTDNVKLKFRIKTETQTDFINKLADLTNGKAEISFEKTIIS